MEGGVAEGGVVEGVAAEGVVSSALFWSTVSANVDWLACDAIS